MVTQLQKKLRSGIGFLAGCALTLLTMPTQAQVNYSYDFQAGLGGWTGAGITYGATTCSGGSARVNQYFAGPAMNISSPLLGTSLGGPSTLAFDYKIVNWSAGTVATPNPWGTMEVQWSNNPSGPWFTIGTIDSTNHVVTNICTTKTYNFVPTPGSLFVRLSSTWQFGDYFIYLDNVSVTEAPATPCSGTPNGGTLPAVVYPCGQTMVSLSPAGATFAADMVYQWQQSVDGGVTWVNISGSNAISYSVNVNNSPAGALYQLSVTCTTSGQSATSTATTIGAQTPVPTATNNSPVCVGQTVQLTAAGNFTPNTTFLWTGPNGFTSTLQNPVIPNATWTHTGTYQVVTLQNGCSSAPSATFVSVAQGQGQLWVSANQPGCLGGTLTLVADGGVAGSYVWSGPNGFTGGSNIVSIPNYQPVNYGTYTVSSGSGACAAMGTITVGAPVGPVVPASLSVCPGSSINLWADSAWNAVSYSWTGPNGFTSSQQNPVITNPDSTHSGAYTVWANYGNCISPPSVVQVTVTGILNVAAANNGPINQGGTLILTANGSGGNYSWTGPNGYSAIGHNPYIQNVQPMQAGDYTVTLESFGCTTVTAVTSVVVNPMNTITGTVYNDLNNNGTQDANENFLSGVLVTIQPGNLVAITDTFGVYTAYVADGTYTVAVAGLQNYQTSTPASHSVTVAGLQTSASNNFGIYTAAVNNLAVILTEVWTAAPGFTTFHRITYSNLGNTPMNGTVRYLRDAQLVLNPNTTGYTTSGDTLIWSFSNLLPGQTAYKYVYMTVPVGTALGTLLNSTAWVTPLSGDADSTNNTFTLTQLVTGSWDPNDKAVQPTGPIAVQEVTAGKELVYTVRFQNTGTAPAVNVLLIDTLSANLDLSTFQMLSSSHNYELTMRENGILEWRFNNIMLPDSNANEPASHGDVHYRIMPKTNLVVGDVIENTAHIFFDFNEAVVTNTTHTPVGILAAPALTETANLHLFPNPNNGQAMLEFTAANQAETTVSVLNLLGQEVWQMKKTTEAGQVEIPVELEQQPAGIYLVKVQQNGKVYSTKLVRQ